MCVCVCVCACMCERVCVCAVIQFSSGIIRVSQTWRKSRQECVTKCCVVVAGNVKNPNNGVHVTKGGKMFLLLN